MNMRTATGAGGIAYSPVNITSNAALAGDIQNDSDNKSMTHGVLFAVLTIMIVPLDSLVALVLRRWPKLHVVSSMVVLAFMIAGVATGVQISAQYLAVSGPVTLPYS
jgi:hypothetical protein